MARLAILNFPVTFVSTTFLLILFLLVLLSHQTPPQSQSKWKVISAVSKLISVKNKSIENSKDHHHHHHKKRMAIDTIEECGLKLGAILGEKSAQMLAIMKWKRDALAYILSKIEKKHLPEIKEDEALFRELLEVFAKVVAEVRKTIPSSPLTLTTFRDVHDWHDEEKGELVGEKRSKTSLEFGEFMITKLRWESSLSDDNSRILRIYTFHKADSTVFDEFATLFGDLSVTGKKQLSDVWLPADSAMNTLIGILQACDLFVRAFAGENKAHRESQQRVLEDKDQMMGHLSLGPFVDQPLMGKMYEEMSILEAAKKFLAALPISQCRPANLHPGEADHHTAGTFVIHDRVHDVAFFDELFAPYLEELFTILAKDRNNGGFDFQLTVQPGYIRKLVLKVHRKEVVDKEKKEEEEKKQKQKDENSSSAADDADQFSAVPLGLESELMAQLLVSVYAKIVERLQDVRSYTVDQVAKQSERFSQMFHAYGLSLASELHKRMEEVQRSYGHAEVKNCIIFDGEIFHDMEKEFTDTEPGEWSSSEEADEKVKCWQRFKEREERWQKLQALHAKLETKRHALMREMVSDPGMLFVLGQLGYKDLAPMGTAGSMMVQKRAEALGQIMEMEMEITLDNLEMNWAADCNVDDAEECVFSENRDFQLDVRMAEMSLFGDQNRKEMSKVQRFFDWIYRKLGRRIDKLTTKFQNENSWIKSYLLGTLIDAMDHLRQFMEQKIGLDDLLIPFWHELKVFVVRPALKEQWIAPVAEVFKQKFMQALAQIRSHIRDPSRTEIFVDSLVFIHGKLEGMADKLATGKGVKKGLGSVLRGLGGFLLKRLDVFSALKEQFHFKRLPRLAKLFSNVLRKRDRSRVTKAVLVDGNRVTAQGVGHHKDWHRNLEQKVVSVFVINAAMRPINIVVVNHGSMAAFGMSSAFFIITILYMNGVLWLCQHLFWSITCGAAFVHCGHYMAVGFAIVAAIAWMAIVLIVF